MQYKNIFSKYNIMSYYCKHCDYLAKNSSNFSNHKKTKKHLFFTQNDQQITIISPNVSSISCNVSLSANNTAAELQYFFCEKCNEKFNHRSSLSRHNKKCTFNNDSNKIKQELIEKECQLKILEKEKEFIEKMEKEKSELLKEKTEFINNFMANANVLLNKANDNTKITAQTLQTVSTSALKYANDKFKDTPALLPLDNFNINNLNFDNEEDKKQLVELLIYNAKQKSLDKLLGNHIIKEYKKENPEEQVFHATDCSRLNYIVRELIENALIWSVDKNGIKICSSVVKPLIKKCIAALMEHQKVLLNEMMLGNLNKQKEVELIIDIIMSIDSGLLENEINKYIAPFFNLNKLE